MNAMTRGLELGLDRLLSVMIRRSGELHGERLAGFMFAVRLVQAFRSGLS